MFDLEGTDTPDLIESLDVADATTEEPTEADVAVLQMTEEGAEEALQMVDVPSDEFDSIEKAA